MNYEAVYRTAPATPDLLKTEKGNITQKVCMGFFLDFEISNLSQKILTQIILAFRDTSTPPMRNVGSQLTNN